MLSIFTTEQVLCPGEVVVICITKYEIWRTKALSASPCLCSGESWKGRRKQVPEQPQLCSGCLLNGNQATVLCRRIIPLVNNSHLFAAAYVSPQAASFQIQRAQAETESIKTSMKSSCVQLFLKTQQCLAFLLKLQAEPMQPRTLC